VKKIIEYFFHIIENRYLIYQMVKRNVTAQYKKSKLGMFWSLAEPLAFMGILYFVFGIGLKGGRKLDIPFICYLVSGMAVISYFTGTLTKGTSAVRMHAFLLKKVNINLSILPVVTVLSGIVDHILFFIAALIILLVNQKFPNLFWFQIFYYLFSLSIFLLGITWFTSSVGVFFPDLQSIVTVISRLVFYFTPIFWNFEMIPENLKFWVKLNPLFYIATGYRESLFYSVPFWRHPYQTLYFWIWTIVMLWLGTFTFRRLRPQFADFI
jgi:ABC-type polysaccharide/polyol phosphate export permease